MTETPTGRKFLWYLIGYVAELRTSCWGGATFNGWEGYRLALPTSLVLAPGRLAKSTSLRCRLAPEIFLPPPRNCAIELYTPRSRTQCTKKSPRYPSLKCVLGPTKSGPLRCAQIMKFLTDAHTRTPYSNHVLARLSETTWGDCHSSRVSVKSVRFWEISVVAENPFRDRKK